MSRAFPSQCTLGEAMIYQIALTIEDGIMAFHGFGSPLVQVAMHLARQTHAPHLVLVAGATYGVNPSPLFMTPTTNDWAVSRGSECHLGLEELFDLAAGGRLGRMFLSGLQIDRFGNLNVTQLGQEQLLLKLPGGGGGCNLSSDAEHVTIWTTGHRATRDAKGRRRFRLVEHCDFITSVGHRTADGKTRSEMGFRGKGPDSLITELGVFDFDDSGQARLKAVYPDVDPETVSENTGFEFKLSKDFSQVDLPTPDMVNFIRRLDSLRIHERELKHEDLLRCFSLN